MNNNKRLKPGLLTFQKKGKRKEGHLSICSSGEGIPFKIKRVFWAYGTPDNVSRGRHAHHKTEMIIIAVNGNIRIDTMSTTGIRQTFRLSDPNKGLYIPPMYWHEMWYSPDAVQLVICSTYYDETDYIRNKKEFEKRYR